MNYLRKDILSQIVDSLITCWKYLYCTEATICASWIEDMMMPSSIQYVIQCLYYESYFCFKYILCVFDTRPLNRSPCWPPTYIFKIVILVFKKKFFNVHLFLRERERECQWGIGRERGRHRIGSRLQALSCQHRARRGLELTDREIMTWAKVGWSADWTTQAPLFAFI